MKKDEPPFRATERWAHFRFSVIGSLLAAPPARGQLQAQLQALADKKWRHPIGGHSFTLGFSTIERWYHKASAAKAGPVQVLQRKIRSDQGQHPALSAALVTQLTEQYRQHPSWSYQLHADNLAARITTDPTLGSQRSYATVVRFMHRHGLIKRPRRGPVHSPGGQAAEARFQAREVRSFENPYVSTGSGIWIFTTARGGCSGPRANGASPFCWASSMIIRACAAMPSGIWPKAPRNCVTA